MPEGREHVLVVVVTFILAALMSYMYRYHHPGTNVYPKPVLSNTLVLHFSPHPCIVHR